MRFFPSLANIAVLVYFSHLLPKDLYGTYQDIWVQYYVFGAIACAGIHALVITYAPGMLARLASSVKTGAYLGFAGWMIIVSVVFALFQLAFLPFITGASLLFFLSASVLTEAVLVAFRRFRFLAITSLGYSIVFCLLHWLAIKHSWSLQLLFTAIAVLAALRATVSFVIVYTCIQKQEKETGNVNHAGVMSLWRHMGLYDLMRIMSIWLDKLVLGYILSKELFAVYFNGSVDIPFLPLIISAAGSAGLLQLAVANDDKEQQAQRLMLQTGRVLSCIVFPLFFFLLLFREELFAVVFSGKYAASVPVFLASVFAVPIRALGFTSVLQHYHKGRIINIGAVLDLAVAGALMYPLYLVIGLPGIALSFVIATYAQAIFYLYQTSKILRYPMLRLIPAANWLTKLIVFAIVFIAIHYVLAANFQQQIVLFLGTICLAVVVTVTLLAEIKSRNKHYV